MNHTALLVDLLGVEGQTVGPVVQDEQTRVECALACGGDIRYVVDGLVDRCVRVQVLAELHTDALTPADDLVALEVVGAVEAHVLQEVSQTALVVVLLDRADTLGDVELSTFLGPVVMTDVVGEPVVELTNADVFVDGQRHHHLCHGYLGHQQYQCCNERFS